MICVTIHEVSHGVVALRCGDTTALNAGRLTLNPLKHIDPMGTVILPLFLILFHLPVFGWAKPVPINPARMRHPKQDILWVGIAGPISNFLCAASAAVLLKIISGNAWPPLLADLTRTFIVMNLILGVFNLIPVPPLDGSRILIGLLPPAAARFLLVMEKWGILIVLLLISLGWIDRFLWPLVAALAKVLGL